MYPDWPESPSDLVPLPLCEGPKLEPFDFQGPQKIDFIQHIGEGSHSHVFKFKFVGDEEWECPVGEGNKDNLEALTAFSKYAEPFNCECRAFGRLKEAGCEHLATKCFGYLLLEDYNERAMMYKFKDLALDFTEHYEEFDVRSRFLGKGGRPPPIRGIIKELGQPDEKLRTRTLRSILQDVIQIQQLGMISLDIAHRQIINGKLSDFSTTITFPHFITSPELNPHLEPEVMARMELQTFKMSLHDYCMFDDMVREWNYDHQHPRDQLAFYSLPGGKSGQGLKYELRGLPSRDCVYTLADPRTYDWRSNSHGESGAKVTKKRRRPRANPSRWFYQGDPDVVAKIKRRRLYGAAYEWHYRDGHAFPHMDIF
ncbi:hypothetical protein CEP54_009279 [Fusarium duplospermum]|uniref:Uncharacterized protein n=1 Tax=Fusarium duplospermum TaxID=1325734 RepID=A0A428PRE2_9HYPO|nr:hypothetical protein CEP54_009279 [Fusarium duplospermum]